MVPTAGTERPREGFDTCVAPSQSYRATDDDTNAMSSSSIPLHGHPDSHFIVVPTCRDVKPFETSRAL